MSETLGTIKFLENRIIIKRNDGTTETWSRAGSDVSNFLTHNGYTYRLVGNNESEVKETIKKYQQIEEEVDDEDNFEEEDY